MTRCAHGVIVVAWLTFVCFNFVEVAVGVFGSAIRLARLVKVQNQIPIARKTGIIFSEDAG